MTEKPIWEALYEHLGGRRFRMMTGAREMLGDDTSLRFRLPGHAFCKNGVNYVKISQEASGDLFRMEVGRLRSSVLKHLETREHVPAKELTKVFSELTGLAVKL